MMGEQQCLRQYCTEQLFGVSSSFMQSREEKQSKRWRAMKEHSVIPVSEAFP